VEGVKVFEKLLKKVFQMRGITKCFVKGSGGITLDPPFLKIGGNRCNPTQMRSTPYNTIF
jgi:hypothetical protein